MRSATTGPMPTRARDQLLVTGVAPASEFLDDLCDTQGVRG